MAEGKALQIPAMSRGSHLKIPDRHQEAETNWGSAPIDGIRPLGDLRLPEPGGYLERFALRHHACA